MHSRIRRASENSSKLACRRHLRATSLTARRKPGTSDRGSVRVLRTDTRWFGLTNRQDLPDAKAVIAGLVATGAYPAGLWDHDDGG